MGRSSKAQPNSKKTSISLDPREGSHARSRLFFFPTALHDLWSRVAIDSTHHHFDLDPLPLRRLRLRREVSLYSSPPHPSPPLSLVFPAPSGIVSSRASIPFPSPDRSPLGLASVEVPSVRLNWPYPTCYSHDVRVRVVPRSPPRGWISHRATLLISRASRCLFTCH